MGHDASKIQLGTTFSNIKDVDNLAGTVEAGLIVRRKSDGTLSIASADGLPVGISLGSGMSGNGRTAIARRGLSVPVQLTDAFNPAVGAQVHISDTTGKAVAAGAGATGMNATYASTRKTGIKEDGASEVGAAYIDMVGGL